MWTRIERRIVRRTPHEGKDEPFSIIHSLMDKVLSTHVRQKMNRCLSLNVFSCQVKPPQRAALGAAERVPAAAAAAAPAASKIRANAPVRFMNLAVVIVRLASATVYPGRVAGVAELANALGLGPSGVNAPYRFKSCRPH